MLIKELHLEPSVEAKMALKHGVIKSEIEAALFSDEPKYFKARNGRYMAVGRAQRLITIIFEYHEGIAEVITAYLSSEWQRKLYERK